MEIDKYKTVITGWIKEFVTKYFIHTHNNVDSLPIDASNITNLPKTSPGGSNMQVQFNDSGVFGGNAGLLYDKSVSTLYTDNVSGIIDSLSNFTVTTPYSVPNLSSENVLITTGGGADDNAVSGNITVGTGDMSGTSDSSGTINVTTGNTQNSSNSGNLSITSGSNNVGDNGNAGLVSISGGSVLAGTGGKIAGWVVLLGGGVGTATGNRIGGGVLIRARVGHGTGANGFISLTNATSSSGVGTVNIIINGGGDSSGSINTPTGNGGKGVVFLADANTTPTSNPTGGGILYSTGGALHWLGSSGTDTPIAPA